jgi:hypothetical protein
MAKANPAWQTLDGSSILTIFHGPHCYISPDWYGKPGNVPTWNYISIQVRGDVKIIHDFSFLRQALIELGQKHNSSFDIEKNVNDHQNLLANIVGIEITIADILAKFKFIDISRPGLCLAFLYYLDSLQWPLLVPLISVQNDKVVTGFCGIFDCQKRLRKFLDETNSGKCGFGLKV